MKRAMVAAAMVALSATSGQAALFVSGDVNPFSSPAPTAGNLQFLYNLAGAGTVVVQPGEGQGIAAGRITDALDDAGIPWVLLEFDAVVQEADLMGASLYLSAVRSVDWSAAERALLRQFAAVDGHVLLAGENSFFTAQNGFATALAAAMGTDLAIVDDELDNGVRREAQILAANAFTAGTDGLDYVSTSRVTGGTALYGTEEEGIPFIAYAEVAPIPEPAIWALMILGFGATGAAMRRRGAVTA